MVFCVTTDLYLFSTSEANSGCLESVYTVLVEFPCPNKIDCFVHNDGDRKSKLLSLSLLYNYKNTVNIRFLDKINLIGQLDFMLKKIFVTVPKNMIHFRGGYKWPKNNHLAYFVNIQPKSLIRSIQWQLLLQTLITLFNSIWS